MIVDSSALIAIILDESDADLYTDALGTVTTPRISAATYVEAGVVADGGQDPVTTRMFDNLISRGGFVIEPFTAEQTKIARTAYRDFGRGSGHPARLNFGDCMSYALAKALDQPLLYKGDDFGHTDVESVL